METVKIKVESRRMTGFTGQESCQARVYGQTQCEPGKTTRHYGEFVEFGFSGWRGPYCSVKCYRAAYPVEPAE